MAEMTRRFKVDTRRHRSRAKLQSKFRHVFGIMTIMFPLAAGFMCLMAFIQFETLGQRMPLFNAAILCVAAGAASALLWGITVAMRNQRHATTRREREARHQAQAEELRKEREKIASRRAEASAAEPGAGSSGAP